MDSDGRIPWEKVTVETLLALCKDLDVPSHVNDRTTMVSTLRSIERKGLDATLKELDACDSPGNSDDSGPAEAHEVIEGLQLNLTAIGGYNVCRDGSDDSDEEGDSNIFWVPEDEPDVGYWFKIFKVSITTDDGEKVGKFFFRVVDQWARGAKERHDKEMALLSPEEASRTQIFPSDFYGLIRDPDSPGEELQQFVPLLFDKSGRLRKQFYQGGDKGTGVFGPELGKGSFAIICCCDGGGDLGKFQVEDKFAGRGVEPWALSVLLKHRVLEDVDFVYAWPEEGIDRFKRAGFRRVGTTPFLAYAVEDDKHPSRKLAISKDAKRNPNLAWEWKSERTILDMF